VLLKASLIDDSVIHKSKEADMSITKHFDETVRNTQKTLNITQEELADTAGINQSHMGQIERG
jgi:ribosome-binding protein aMBF1 (putative translation factor)